MIEVRADLYEDKTEIFSYFRDRAEENLEEITKQYGEKNHKEVSRQLNPMIQNTKNELIKVIEKKSESEGWSNEEELKNILQVTYCSDAVMLEYRNEVWPYGKMTFSRRVGEIWEPFCKLCFEYPVNEDIEIFAPPVFEDVKDHMESEFNEYIDQLNLTEEQKSELKRYYEKVWKLVNSGSVKMELDLHFEKDEDGNEKKYIVDFKSGFSSNEKGNTNRLLLVATAYQMLEDDYQCVMLVRAPEEENNKYYTRLEESGVWEASCGKETYEKIKKYTGFDLTAWIEENINWEQDLPDDMIEHLRENELMQYLRWIE